MAKKLNNINRNYTYVITNADNSLISSGNLTKMDGVAIHFNRYSLYKDGDQNYLNFSLNGNFPKSTGIYEYCRRCIADGYIYVYSEKLKNIVEYRCEAGTLGQGSNPSGKNYWNKNTPDIRPIAKGEDDYIILSRNSVHWFAYSSEQWSSEYVRKMIDKSDLREKRFQKLDFKDAISNPDVSFYDDNLIYYKYKNEMVDSTNSESVAYHKYKQFLILANLYKNKDRYIFFSLHDPIGLATDLQVDHMMELAKLSQLIVDISQKSQASNLYTAEDYNYLHLHALAFYTMLYGAKATDEKQQKAIETLRKEIVSEDFLKKILLVEERESIRSYIESIRTVLLRVMESEYYTSVMDDFIFNHPINREKAISRIVNHFNTITIDASLKDRHLDIGDTSNSFNNQEIAKFLNKVVSPGHKIDELFSIPVDLEDILVMDRLEAAKQNMIDNCANISKKQQAIVDGKVGIDLDQSLDILYLLITNKTNMAIAFSDYNLSREAKFKKENNKDLKVEKEKFRVAHERLIKADNDAVKARQKQVDYNNKVSKIHSTPKGDYLSISITEKWLNNVNIRERTLTGPKGGKTKIKCWVFDELSMDRVLEDMYCIRETPYIRRGGPGNKGQAGVPTRRIASTEGAVLEGYRKHILMRLPKTNRLEMPSAKGCKMPTATWKTPNSKKEKQKKEYQNSDP